MTKREAGYIKCPHRIYTLILISVNTPKYTLIERGGTIEESAVTLAAFKIVATA